MLFTGEISKARVIRMHSARGQEVGRQLRDSARGQTLYVFVSLLNALCIIEMKCKAIEGVGAEEMSYGLKSDCREKERCQE